MYRKSLGHHSHREYPDLKKTSDYSTIHHSSFNISFTQQIHIEHQDLIDEVGSSKIDQNFQAKLFR